MRAGMWVSCDVGEPQCGAIAVWGNCSVGVLRCGGSCGVGKSGQESYPT